MAPKNASLDELLKDFSSGKLLALSRLISAVENQPETCLPLLAKLYEKAGKAHVIGITGPPGAGKSTLVNALIQHFRRNKETVAVVAVDPSSPFSGGAILGDRIRMLSHYEDKGVFIRSLSTRGAIGGLSRATRGIVTVFDAFGFDKVIVETVGVGQTEFQILNLVHTAVVVLVPESGDSIQTQKAGLLEIADIFVVNKADRPGASRIAGDLDESAQLGVGEAWRVPILMTKAREEDGYEGVPALAELLVKHRRFLQEDEHGKKRRQADLISQWKGLVVEELERRFSDIFAAPGFDDYLQKISQAGTNPYILLEQFLSELKQRLSHG